MMIMEGISFWSILNGISLGILLAVIVQAIVSFRTIKKKLYVIYKDPLEGQTIMKVIATLMPQKIIKSMAPKKRSLDVFEVLQDDPYEIK